MGRFLQHAFGLWTLLVLVQSEARHEGDYVEEGTSVREYVPGAWSSNFYRPHQLKITGIGLTNQETAYLSSRWGVSELQQGHLQRLPLEVGDAEEISAFHLCHHRSSFFYEVRTKDGSRVTIFEHSLLFDNKLKVWHEEDTPPATSLACVDKLLLRASSTSLLAIDIESVEHDEEHAVVSVLFEYESDREDVITSIATGYAADVYTHSQVYALIPHNRTLLRLHLEPLSEPKSYPEIVAETEIILSGGDGSDGALSSASAYEPLFVLSVHDTILFADGCSLRQISDGRVRTLLGMPAECIVPQNETVEPVPWATRLSKPQALAGADRETFDGTVLALTGAQVISVVQREDECSRQDEEDACSSQPGCGWAEGERSGEHLCFSCESLHQWAKSQATALDPCVLELEPRVNTAYRLGGCGCVAPTPEPDGAGLTALQIIVGGSVIIAVAAFAVLYYRASRRAAAMRELYGADTCEFHIFTDAEDEP